MEIIQPWETHQRPGHKLWQWIARDHAGHEREYQCEMPAKVSIEEATAHLQRHYRNVTIVNIEPIPEGRRRPPKGLIEAHIYDLGIVRKLQQQKLIETFGPEEWRRLRERNAVKARPLPQPIQRESLRR